MKIFKNLTYLILIIIYILINFSINPIDEFEQLNCDAIIALFFCNLILLFLTFFIKHLINSGFTLGYYFLILITFISLYWGYYFLLC